MTEPGRAFELEVKNKLEFEIQNGSLGILPECAVVFHRKSYFSQQRKKDIVMDIVIELYRPGTTEAFLLWIWECKDYQDKVPVDDIEEFHAKMEQIKLHKTKGTVVCRNGFQESAVTYAESMGIGLARLLPTESLVRMTEAKKHKEVPRNRVKSGLTQERTEIFFESYFFGLLSSGKGVDSLSDLIAGEICHFFDDAL